MTTKTNKYLIQLTVLLSKMAQPVAAMHMAKGCPVHAILELDAANAPTWLIGSIRHHWPLSPTNATESLHGDVL
jgi:hypothetical protein